MANVHMQLREVRSMLESRGAELGGASRNRVKKSCASASGAPESDMQEISEAVLNAAKCASRKLLIGYACSGPVIGLRNLSSARGSWCELSQAIPVIEAFEAFGFEPSQLQYMSRKQVPFAHVLYVFKFETRLFVQAAGECMSILGKSKTALTVLLKRVRLMFQIYLKV
jgi:hypothetical protein